MKVVFLHPPLYPVNHQFFNLLGKKVDLTVICFGNSPGLHETWSVNNYAASNYNLKIIEGKTNLKRFAVSYRIQMNPTFLKDLFTLKPDIVISVAFWIPSLYASLFKKIVSYKFLITTDAISETEKNLSKTKKCLRKHICKNTDGFISASKLTSQYLTKLCSKVSIFESLQTIDVNTWEKELKQLPPKVSLREELNLPKNKKILLGVGNFTKNKNWKAVLNLIPKIDNIIFVLIGYGEQEQEYIELIKNLRIEKKVLIKGKKEGDELKKYYKTSDIFILSSFQDTFGFVVPEALISGLSIICTKFAGASSLIENGINGYVIDPNNDFTKEIGLILENLGEFQENAVLSINKYTLENRVDEFVNIFKSLKA